MEATFPHLRVGLKSAWCRAGSGYRVIMGEDKDEVEIDGWMDVGIV